MYAKNDNNHHDNNIHNNIFSSSLTKLEIKPPRKSAISSSSSTHTSSSHSAHAIHARTSSAEKGLEDLIGINVGSRVAALQIIQVVTVVISRLLLWIREDSIGFT